MRASARTSWLRVAFLALTVTLAHAQRVARVELTLYSATPVSFVLPPASSAATFSQSATGVSPPFFSGSFATNTAGTGTVVVALNNSPATHFCRISLSVGTTGVPTISILGYGNAVCTVDDIVPSYNSMPTVFKVGLLEAAGASCLANCPQVPYNSPVGVNWQIQTPYIPANHSINPNDFCAGEIASGSGESAVITNWASIKTSMVNAVAQAIKTNYRPGGAIYYSRLGYVQFTLTSTPTASNLLAAIRRSNPYTATELPGAASASIPPFTTIPTHPAGSPWATIANNMRMNGALQTQLTFIDRIDYMERHEFFVAPVNNNGCGVGLWWGYRYIWSYS